MQIGVKDWYSEVRSSPGFFIQSTLDQLLSHQVNGVLPVFVSGSSQEILAPLADELGVHYVLANKLEIVRNRYTGEIIPPQTIGIGKRDVILFRKCILNSKSEIRIIIKLTLPICRQF